jgi:hypothetical protein
MQWSSLPSQFGSRPAKHGPIIKGETSQMFPWLKVEWQFQKKKVEWLVLNS